LLFKGNNVEQHHVNFGIYIYIFLWPNINFKAAFLSGGKGNAVLKRSYMVMQMSEMNVKTAVKN